MSTSKVLLASDFLAQLAGGDVTKLDFSISDAFQVEYTFPRRKRKQASIDFRSLPSHKFAFRVLCSFQSRSS